MKVKENDVMKRYTLEEANQLLPVLSKEFDSLHNLQREFDLWYESFQQVEPQLNAEEKAAWEKRIQFMELEAEMFISNILSHGVWFEDAFSSTLHFPAILNGKKVYSNGILKNLSSRSMKALKILVIW